MTSAIHDSFKNQLMSRINSMVSSTNYPTDRICAGCTCRVHGLMKSIQFNDRLVEVLSVDTARGRCEVRLEEGHLKTIYITNLTAPMHETLFDETAVSENPLVRISHDRRSISTIQLCSPVGRDESSGASDASFETCSQSTMDPAEVEYVIKSIVTVSSTLRPGGRRITELRPGTCITVLEVLDFPAVKRLRGRINLGPKEVVAYISLKNTATGFVWAEPSNRRLSNRSSNRSSNSSINRSSASSSSSTSFLDDHEDMIVR